MCSEFVHIIIGAEKRDFTIHKGLICHYSKFFDAAFEGKFSEGSSGIVELRQESVTTFEIVYIWLYSRNLNNSGEERDEDCTHRQLAEVFVFGDRYDMAALCNATLDEIIRLYEMKGNVLAEPLQYIYENTLPSSPLRGLVMATYTTQPKILTGLFRAHREYFLDCPEFLLEFSREMIKSHTNRPEIGGSYRHIANPCQYHRHADGEAKCP